MNGQAYLIAAYLVAAGAYGGYLIRLRMRAESLRVEASRRVASHGERVCRG